VVDQYTTAAKSDGTTYYTSATGNAPRVGVSGLEIDGVYGGIARTTLRFSAAYNRAVYKDFPNSAQPVESGDLTSAVVAVHPAEPYRSVNGKALAGAPRFTFNVGADYNQPLASDKVGHVSANLAYSTGYNADVALSKYATVGAHALVDLAVGAGKRDKSFDVSVIVKNLFNNVTPQSRTWNSLTPATPRTYGIQFTGKL
jgi:iron complex outermembrane recepter protein